MSSSSSFPLMLVYAVVALALQALSILVILMIEPLLGGWSGVVFMACYLLAFWVAWSISVRLTEPKAANAPAAQAKEA